jgi:hypothetical protein
LLASGGQAANIFAAGELSLPFFASTGGFKQVFGLSSCVPNVAPLAGTPMFLTGGGLWLSTAAITDIELTPTAGFNFAISSWITYLWV